METLIVKKVNEVYMEVDCDGGSCWELQDYFTFTVPGMQFMPAVRNKFWDGKIRLFNPQTKRIYSGLLHHVQKFCDDLIASYIRKRTLIIVPTISLVQQMAGDFKSYGYQAEPHCITAGVDKETDNLLTISTWQSIHKMPKKWFEQFDLVIGDEAHLFKSKSLTSIMTKTVGTEYKFGFTGTLDGTTTHKLVLEGLFGPVEKVTTTDELIKKGTLAEFNVKCLELQYPDEIKKIHSKDKYQDEVDFLVRNEARNRFLKNLALSLQGNTLLLYQFVEKHGKPLHLEIKNAIDNSVEKDRPVFFVSGEVDGTAREEIRALVEQHDNAIIVASFGTFSTGVNIKRLHNIIFS
ncbi:MAG: hypothetical protein EBW86_08895, partial [Rhodobacteraceae bacterium]|nr:hypothetical protein [Paracoccaceae bacterium]